MWAFEEEEVNDKADEMRVTQQEKKYKDITVKVIKIQDELRGEIYTNQTGKFLVRSSQSNQYLII